MTGGPTGFDGAERYQYDETMSEGRAVEGMRKLKAEGKAPEKLNILMTDGAIGHFTNPWPPDGPTLQSIWEAETGVKLEFIPVSPEEQFNKVIQDVTTGSAAYDVYTFGYAAMGDLSEANGIAPLGEWIEKHGADFADPERGMPTPESYDMLYKYGGEPRSVCYDGDAQVWVYRRDLTEDPANQKEFGDKYGLGDRAAPHLGRVATQLAEFFTSKGNARQRQHDEPLLGHQHLVQPLRQQGQSQPAPVRRRGQPAHRHRRRHPGHRGAREEPRLVGQGRPRLELARVLRETWPTATRSCSAPSPTAPKFLDNSETAIGGKMGSFPAAGPSVRQRPWCGGPPSTSATNGGRLDPERASGGRRISGCSGRGPRGSSAC